MKQILTIVIALISFQSYCQTIETQKSDSIQEGVICRFDMKKHACGQLYYIKTQSDTISVGRQIELDLNLNYKEIPVQVYFTILGDGKCQSKTLSYITRIK
jgi:hypothetical protein